MSFKDAALRIKLSPLNLEGEKNVTHRLEERSICELLTKFGNRVRQQLIQQLSTKPRQNGLPIERGINFHSLRSDGLRGKS
jgi:hypothetical protein